MLTIPEDYEALHEEFCSNFDGIINAEIIEKLKNEKIWAEYPAWDFFGKVWFDKTKNLFACMILIHHSHVNTIFGETPEILKENVCEMYGYN